MTKKRLSLEKRMDVNPMYCETPLRMMLYGFVSAQREIGNTSIPDAVRNFMRFIGLDGDEWVYTVTYSQVAKKMRENISQTERERLEKVFRDNALSIIGLQKVTEGLEANDTVKKVLSEMELDSLKKMQHYISMSLKDRK